MTVSGSGLERRRSSEGLHTSLSSPVLSTLADPPPLENSIESPTPASPPENGANSPTPVSPAPIPPAGLDLIDGRGKMPVYATVNKVRRIRFCWEKNDSISEESTEIRHLIW